MRRISQLMNEGEAETAPIDDDLLSSNSAKSGTFGDLSKQPIKNHCLSPIHTDDPNDFQGMLH